MKRFAWSLLSALVVTALLIAAQRARGDEPPTLSGRWSATAMRVAWNIGDWGPACGPRPSGSGAPGGPVTVRQHGSELSFSGAGRNYSTTECWEQFPGLRRVSHSAGQRNWHNVCKTAPNDSRQATIITTISATDTTISLDETGQYQFVLQGQNCTASARRTRTYRLVQREGEAPPEPTASAPASAPAPAGACSAPGPPARLEVRPSRKLMRPGENFTFGALVVDSQGCVLDRAPRWRITSQHAAAELVAPGEIHVDPNAPEGEIGLSATLGGHSANVVVEVASQARYNALLESGNFNASGESSQAAVAIVASSSIGARTAVARAQARSHKRLFVAVLGAAALALGLLGLLITWRSHVRHTSEAAAASPASKAEPEPAMPPKRSGRVCPTCREEYPPDAEFCATDGNRLVSLAEASGESKAGGGICPVCGQGFDPGVQSCPRHDEELVPASVYLASLKTRSKPEKRICPVCGTQYPGDSQFCGNDGAALVPVN